MIGGSSAVSSRAFQADPAATLQELRLSLGTLNEHPVTVAWQTNDLKAIVVVGTWTRRSTSFIPVAGNSANGKAGDRPRLDDLDVFDPLTSKAPFGAGLRCGLIS